MVQQQQQMMMYEMAQFMQLAGQQGAPGPDFFAGIGDRAKRRVQAGILLGSLARQEGIEVGDDDLDAKFQEIAEDRKARREGPCRLPGSPAMTSSNPSFSRRRSWHC